VCCDSGSFVGMWEEGTMEMWIEHAGWYREGSL